MGVIGRFSAVPKRARISLTCKICPVGEEPPRGGWPERPPLSGGITYLAKHMHGRHRLKAEGGVAAPREGAYRNDTKSHSMHLTRHLQSFASGFEQFCKIQKKIKILHFLTICHVPLPLTHRNSRSDFSMKFK